MDIVYHTRHRCLAWPIVCHPHVCVCFIHLLQETLCEAGRWPAAQNIKCNLPCVRDTPSLSIFCLLLGFESPVFLLLDTFIFYMVNSLWRQLCLVAWYTLKVKTQKGMFYFHLGIPSEAREWYTSGRRDARKWQWVSRHSVSAHMRANLDDLSHWKIPFFTYPLLHWTEGILNSEKI